MLPSIFVVYVYAEKKKIRKLRNNFGRKKKENCNFEIPRRDEKLINKKINCEFFVYDISQRFINFIFVYPRRRSLNF